MKIYAKLSLEFFLKFLKVTSIHKLYKKFTQFSVNFVQILNLQNFVKISLDFLQNFFKTLPSNPTKFMVPFKFYWQIFLVLRLLKILKTVRKICSMSISNKSSRYFFKNLSQSLKEISYFSRNSPNIFPKDLQNFLKIFSSNFILETFKTILLENFANNILSNIPNKFFKIFIWSFCNFVDFFIKF